MYQEPDLVDFDPIDPDLFWKLTAPQRAYFPPVYYGLEKIDPDQPCLFVGNHTIFGVLDVAHILAGALKYRGVMIRALADHMQFQIPGWRQLISQFGIVHGTRENCRTLMQSGQHVLVYPGGAREVCKRKGENYALTWKQRTGFARMAIEHGYQIVPFASVGPDNTVDILLDADDIMASPVGKLLKRTGLAKRFLRDGDLIMPIAKGMGPTLIPRPEKFYLAFGDAIDTSRFAGLDDNSQALYQLRSETEDAINGMIGEMLRMREQDTEKGFLRRLLT